MTKSAKTTPDFFRVKISGTLLCKSNLHIGDGEEQTIEEKRKKHPDNEHDLKHFIDEQDKRPKYNRFVRNSAGKLYAPASTLRGALRQSPIATEKLFGQLNTATSKQQIGGIVRIYDASISVPDSVKPLAYWHPDDKTGLHAGIVIDNKKGVAEHGKLYQHEVIPAGSKISFKLEMDHVNQKDIDSLIDTLKWWDGTLESATAARKSKAWGLLDWHKEITIETCKFTEIQNWIINGGEKPEWKTSYQEIDNKGIENNFTLISQQPLLVNEPGSIKEKRNPDEILPDHTMYRQGDGIYAIPSQTVIGTMRSIARRIILTQLNLNGWDDKHNQTADAFIEAIFGNNRHISKVKSTNLEAEATDLYKQTFIAVDRFTGGVAEGKLYNAEALPPQTKLEGQLCINGKLEPEHRGLLYLVLKELKQGAWLGWGKSKGYGLICLDDGFDSEALMGFTDDSTVQSAINAMNKKCRITEKTEAKDKEKTSSKEAEATEKTTEVTAEAATPIEIETASGINTEQEINDPGKTLEDDQFYNPYSFIPLNNKWTEAGELTPDKTTLDEDNPANNHARHDLYLPDCHSGVIRCCLTTVTDTLVGNEHQDQIVKPYKHNGKVAFPANSLRGMIGTTIEAISQSSLRVLQDNKLSITAGQNVDRNKGKLVKKNNKFFIKDNRNNRQEYPVTSKATNYAEVCNQTADKKIDFKELNNKTEVWYKLNSQNEVIELSGSLRKPYIDNNPDKSSTYQIFKNSGFENLLPWGATGRDWLHPAELILGIIEEQTEDQKNRDNTQFSLASRLRFTDAISTNEDQQPNLVCQGDDTILLKILASPKQPSEHMYFHKVKDYIENEQLIPNGRKQYLRQNPKNVDQDSYKSRSHRHKDQKIYCNPIAKKQNFTFDIHFNNLNTDELGLLVKAIEPAAENTEPEKDFYHKLGLGKPLGLGTVKVNIDEIKTLPVTEYFSQQQTSLITLDKNSYNDSKLIDPKALKALLKIGKLQSADDLITYPLTTLQKEMYQHRNKEVQALAEEELFKWHTQNNPPPLIKKGKHIPLTPNNKTGMVKKGTLKKVENEWEFYPDNNTGEPRSFELNNNSHNETQDTKQMANDLQSDHERQCYGAIQEKKVILLAIIDEALDEIIDEGLDEIIDEGLDEIIDEGLDLSGEIKADDNGTYKLQLDSCDKTPEYDDESWKQFKKLLKVAQDNNTSIPVTIQAQSKNEYKITIVKIERR